MMLLLSQQFIQAVNFSLKHLLVEMPQKLSYHTTDESFLMIGIQNICSRGLILKQSEVKTRNRTKIFLSCAGLWNRFFLEASLLPPFTII